MPENVSAAEGTWKLAGQGKDVGRGSPNQPGSHLQWLGCTHLPC